MSSDICHHLGASQMAFWPAFMSLVCSIFNFFWWMKTDPGNRPGMFPSSCNPYFLSPSLFYLVHNPFKLTISYQTRCLWWSMRPSQSYQLFYLVQESSHPHFRTKLTSWCINETAEMWWFICRAVSVVHILSILTVYKLSVLTVLSQTLK